MIVGLAVWELHLPGCGSLKEKRSIVKSLKDRMHNKFNVSVAETAHQDAHRRAQLAACIVSGSKAQANSVLTSLDNFISEEPRVRVGDAYTTYY